VEEWEQAESGFGYLVLTEALRRGYQAGGFQGAKREWVSGWEALVRKGEPGHPELPRLHLRPAPRAGPRLRVEGESHGDSLKRACDFQERPHGGCAPICDWTVAAGGGRILALRERSMGNFVIQSFHAEPQEMNLRAAIFSLAHNRRGLPGAL
jgi:hypothetical protein